MPRICVLFLALCLCSTWSGNAAEDEETEDDILLLSRPACTKLAPRLAIRRAKTWLYQLQSAEPAALATRNPDLAVIDYSRDGSAEGAYGAADLAPLHASGTVTLAYFSIGEAEDYRFYWQSAWASLPPSWLGPENPDWPGNYKVRYWDEGWWTAALQPYLEAILAADFDGVYLDIVDAYWFWYDEQGELSAVEAAGRMADLVARIAAYARARRPGFAVCPQNAEGLLDDASADKAALYLSAIDAIGAESVWYNTSAEDRDYRLGLLARFAAAGKRVCSIEYIDQADWADYQATACAAGFPVVPYAADPDQALDEITAFTAAACP